MPPTNLVINGRYKHLCFGCKKRLIIRCRCSCCCSCCCFCYCCCCCVVAVVVVVGFLAVVSDGGARSGVTVVGICAIVAVFNFVVIIGFIFCHF